MLANGLAVTISPPLEPRANAVTPRSRRERD